jgi:hypothetical protein
MLGGEVVELSKTACHRLADANLVSEELKVVEDHNTVGDEISPRSDEQREIIPSQDIEVIFGLESEQTANA